MQLLPMISCEKYPNNPLLSCGPVPPSSTCSIPITITLSATLPTGQVSSLLSILHSTILRTQLQNSPAGSFPPHSPNTPNFILYFLFQYLEFPHQSPQILTSNPPFSPLYFLPYAQLLPSVIPVPNSYSLSFDFISAENSSSTTAPHPYSSPWTIPLGRLSALWPAASTPAPPS